MKTFKQFLEETRIKLTGNFNSSRSSEDFIDELQDTTSEHPFEERSRIFNDHATLHVSRNGSSSVHLHDIRALHPGGGSKALEHLKSLADKHGVTIGGSAKAYSTSSKYPMTTKQLAGYYKKRGFSLGRGNNDDGYPIKYVPKKKQ